MHPRPNNRAARRAACRFPGPYTVGWDETSWHYRKRCVDRQRAKRARNQRWRRFGGIARRHAYRVGNYDGRNVWRG